MTGRERERETREVRCVSILQLNFGLNDFASCINTAMSPCADSSISIRNMCYKCVFTSKLGGSYFRVKTIGGPVLEDTH